MLCVVVTFGLFASLAFRQQSPSAWDSGSAEELRAGTPARVSAPGRGYGEHALQGLPVAGAPVSADAIPWWDLGDDPSRSQRHDTGRYVTWHTNKYCGFNNQREALTAAFFVAHALNRTLLLRRYLPTFHDRRAETNIGRFFDAPAIGRCVPVVWAEDVYGTVPQSTYQAIRHHDPLTPITLEALVTEYGASDSKVLYLPFPWAHPALLFNFTPAQRASYDALHRRCVHFTSEVFAHAMQLRAALRSTRYHVIHFRLQDYRATPLIDCEDFGGHENFTMDNLSCTTPHGHVVDMIDAVQAAREVVGSGDVVYIATNQRKDDQITAFEQFAAHRNLSVAFFDDLCGATPACSEWRKAQSSIHISSVEQVLAAYSHLFFATFPSTWDELVLDIRRWLQAPRAEGQYALFNRKLLQRKVQCRQRSRRAGRARRLHGWDVRWNFCPL